MGVLDIIKNRRSIRKYENKPISREDLTVILEAARLAPSACNSQPWHFVAFDEPEAKKAFAEEAFSGIYKPTQFVENAPVIVAVVSDNGNLATRLGNMVKRTLFWVMDTGIACQNLVLQAQSMGIGSCWIGWFDHKRAAKYLGVGAGKRVEILIALGYPAEAPEPRPRKEFGEVVSFNKYK
jgi:nitroreductase